MLDSLNWVAIGLGIAFALAGLQYYGWIFGVGSKLGGIKRIRMNSMMARLQGRHSERDPADDVEQALNDALNGAPSLGDEPDDDLWIPEVRTPPSPQPDTIRCQREASGRSAATG